MTPQRKKATVVVIDDFGGNYTLGSVPQGASGSDASLAENCFIYPKRVTQRPGLISHATFTPNSVRSIKEYVDQGIQTRRLLVLLSDGSMVSDTLTLYTFATTVFAASALFKTGLGTDMDLYSTTLFGREWMSFTRGNDGEAPPVNWDGTSVVRTAFPGPGESGAVADSVTAGTISAGLHKMRVLFTSKYGYLTAPGPPVSWTAAGGKKASVTGIPTGPSWVNGRILCFTAVDDEDYFFTVEAGMVIADNTTDAATVDFSDTQLLAGRPVSVGSDPDSDLLRLISLPAQAWTGSYNGRLVHYGERPELVLNGDVGFRNLSFDGGWSTNRPLGWTEKIAGETKGTGVTGAIGDFLTITGDGGGVVRGLLANKGLAAAVGSGEPGIGSIGDYRIGFIPPGKNVRIRIRARKAATLTTGTFYAYLANTTDANGFFPASSFSLAAGSMSSTEFQVFEGELCSSFVGAATQELRIVAGKPDTNTNLFNNGGAMHIDDIQVYFSDNRSQPSLARWSKGGNGDSYDGLTGYQYVSQDNGERLMCGFELGGAWYHVKERSIYATRDDGISEPANWGVEQISNTVGTESRDGVGRGDQWVALAARDGLYLFGGGEPICVSDHIRDTWRSITHHHNLKCHVDMDRKAIYVAAAVAGDAGFEKSILCFQWYGASPFGQKLVVNQWKFQTSTQIVSIAPFVDVDGDRHLYLGLYPTERFLEFDDAEHSDYDTAIHQRYRTRFLGDPVERRLFGRFRASIRGLGTCTPTSYFPDGSTTVAHPDFALPTTTIEDVEYPFTRHVSERSALEFSTNLADSWFSLEKLAIFYSTKFVTPIRGRRT